MFKFPREQFAKSVFLRDTGIRFPLKNENYNKRSWETLARDAYLPHQVVPVVEEGFRVHLRVRRKEVEGDGGGVGREARIAGDLVADLIVIVPNAIEISPKREWKKYFSPERKIRACR